jgi:hypothetical protein
LESFIECKHLLSRMLVTNPSARATLQEVMSHSWMVRGFPGPPAVHLVHREPLRADDLDRQVIRGMKGFEFGTEEEIERRLITILESEGYIRAVQHWERKRNIGGNLNGNSSSYSGSRWGESFSNSSLAISFDSNISSKNDTNAPKKSRRFSSFDYYRRKLFSPASSPPGTPLSHSPPNSHHHLAHPSFSDSNREPMDPTKGFHPLISMYYLSREKLERDRVYGPGQFASSQLSIHGDAANVAAANLVTPVDDASLRQQQFNSVLQSPRALPLPPKKDNLLPDATAKADYSIALPRLPAPETLHFSGMSYDNNTVAPSPTSPAFSHPQPRARDFGLPPPSPSTQARHIEIEQPTVGPQRNNLPRAPPASTHRRSHSMSQRPTVMSRARGGMFGTGDAANDYGVNNEMPKTVGPDTSNFPERLDDNHDRLHPFSSGVTLVRKFGSMLVGRGDVRKSPSGTLKRNTIFGKTSTSPRHSTDMKSGTSISGGGDEEKAPFPDTDGDGKEEESAVLPIDSGSPTPSKPISHSVSQPSASVHRRAATILDSQGRGMRHERRSSTGAALAGSPASTFGRHRRPSTGYNSISSKPLAFFSRHEPSDLAEKREEEEVGDKTMNGEETFKEEDERHTTEKGFKPVFLKGLFRCVCFGVCFCFFLLIWVFSVATTSTKAPSVIKADIRRVLDRMQVQYRDMKGGFECIHLPSIDLTSIETSTNKGSHHLQASSTSGDTSSMIPISNSRRSIVKKASKLSFTLKRDKGKEKDHSFDNNKDKDREATGRPSEATVLTTPSSDSSSFINVASNHTVVPSQDKETIQTQANGSSVLPNVDPILPDTASPVNKAKVLPPLPLDFAPASPLPVQSPLLAQQGPSPLPTGEVDRDVFESMGNNSLSVRFEINIVKVIFICICLHL